MIGPAPLCMECKHLHDSIPGQWGFRCSAFPDGIPDEIFDEEFDHHHPYDGDRGFQFEAEG